MLIFRWRGLIHLTAIRRRIPSTSNSSVMSSNRGCSASSWIPCQTSATSRATRRPSRSCSTSQCAAPEVPSSRDVRTYCRGSGSTFRNQPPSRWSFLGCLGVARRQWLPSLQVLWSSGSHTVARPLLCDFSVRLFFHISSSDFYLSYFTKLQFLLICSNPVTSAVSLP